MEHGDRPSRPAGQPAVDLLVAGGGIMGLWTAYFAARSGLSVLLAERRRIGAGASGGMLGALMPHLPDRWDAKTAFQFESLVALEAEIAGLEAETGLSTGYRRSGRLIPLPKAHHRGLALGCAAAAATLWQSGGRAFSFDVRDRPPVVNWPAENAMENGVAFDGLAARVSPRGLLAALVAALSRLPHVTLCEGAGLARLDPGTQTAFFEDGGTCNYGHCVLAAGVETFDLLATLGPALKRPAGFAVKGQAALLRADIDPALPLLFANGLYIVPHENGLVAVGSTSENAFETAFTTDEQLEDLIARARQLTPLLEKAPVVERWAGLRPKAIGRDPMVGRHPDHPAVSLMTGGFKVSFGLAAALARVVTGQIGDGGPSGLPSSFTVEAHLAKAGLA
ncbi:FAD-binding oxidoreductase [Shinella daejeonensis]|uniref:NAD(P)/FAD-dependent oxidoreductase n=1 Tax=Shinella daejeonensis TaxID=659017 RepID=UPI0020C7732A|nr:FAD-binding oxidoreductase [Shinella daejeonensis]MCP8894056.1 FAD-binding oxidoreductase [Shinella daejeonensis]